MSDFSPSTKCFHAALPIAKSWVSNVAFSERELLRAMARG
jgi:hypothetical protein